MLEPIYHRLVDSNAHFNAIANQLHSMYRLSGLNLCRYLTLRSYDLKRLHTGLSDRGISSLRAPEAYTYRNVADALKLLKLLQGHTWDFDYRVESIGYTRSKALLKEHSLALFGSRQSGRASHIMVTMPTEAAIDYTLVRGMLSSGMTVCRINMSHDDKQVWKAIVRNVRAACKELNVNCNIYVDLGGPKIRTGATSDLAKTGKTRSKETDKGLKLSKGDMLVLHSADRIAYPTKTLKKGQIIEPAGISVSIPSIVEDLRVGHRVYFDDGKISSIVVSLKPGQALLKIDQTEPGGSRLKAEKGINLPDTHLNLPALTDEDRQNLPFVAKYADIVGYSFVRRREDVEMLQHELKALGASNTGIVLKIENLEAFENLPLLLLAAMKSPRIGVMIARGDLAVEVGFERISDIQEQILWFCEAAHIPVIWATQVLENLAKTGIASRAEITDAAMAARAECVMLNKGPYILDACSMLDRILAKMKNHQSKKKTRLTSLEVARLALSEIARLETQTSAEPV